VVFRKKLLTSGFTAGTGESLSIVNREKDMVAISPRSADSFGISPAAVVLVCVGSGPFETSKFKPFSGFRALCI
jgi:hypothetical protein